MNVGPAWIVVLVALGYAYALRSAGRRRRPAGWRIGAFLGGLGVLGAALSGPLDSLAHALFWAHMVQHMLLTIVVPPLVACGQPLYVGMALFSPAQRQALARLGVESRGVRIALAIAAHPLILAVALNVPLVVWHLPTLYEAALANQVLHDLEHLTFLLPSALFWLILLDPATPRHARLSLEGTLLVLFATWMVCDMLGATLALSGAVWYPGYAVSATEWGITAAEDQRRGGLVMWIAGGLFYAAVMLGALVSRTRSRSFAAR
ncbi:MAG: cytochrome c oxidase assembly protein [Chloroflexi bacterium]|nr:cytochrome c oxidase assembly protein [Chloroflexota bacterium]